MSEPEPLPLTGYADPINVGPGDTVRFHVSSPVAYQASLVRLIHGDDDPRGPGFKEVEVPSAADGRRDGRVQPIRMGSCGVADHAAPLDVESVTIEAWVCPTLVDAGHPQAIVAHLAPDRAAGYALVIEPEGDVALWLGDGSTVSKVRTGVPLQPPPWHHRQWYVVTATYDAASGVATVEQAPVSMWPGHPDAARTRTTLEGVHIAPAVAPLVLAAAGDDDAFTHHFNGLIDRPSVFDRALSPDELDQIRAGAGPAAVAGDSLVAAWDFAVGMATDVATDTGPHGLHARLRNDPDRAMTGPRWTRREMDWRHAPDEFSAIAFHEDDVGDVGWDADIELEVPGDLPSGVYAMRLRADDGSEDRIPFFVRPPVGRPNADVAVLFSTMTYLAYANDHCMAWWMAGETTPPSSWDVQLHRPRFEGSPYFSQLDITMREHPEIGSSLYDRYRDGTGTTTVGTRRPLLNFRPDARSWFTGGPRGFPSDLGLVDWLESSADVAYDSITDHDLHAHGADLLSPYRVLIVCSHPEYWSHEMYDALDTYIAGGGRVIHLGGNTHFWVTSVNAERPWVMECRKTYDQDDSGGEPGAQPGPGYGILPWERVHTTGEVGGMWDYRGRSPRGTVGVTSIAGAWQRKEPGYRRLPGSFDERAAFIFEGVHETDLIGDFGLVQNGASGDEIDGVDHGAGTPPHILVLASSAGLHTEGGKAAPSWHRADLAYMEGPNGGAVFSTGSINWISSLSWNGYDNNVSRVTGNVLTRFLDPAPIEAPGSAAPAG